MRQYSGVGRTAGGTDRVSRYGEPPSVTVKVSAAQGIIVMADDDDNEPGESTTEGEPPAHSCPHCEDIEHLKAAVEKLAVNDAENAADDESAAYEALGELLGVGED